MAGPRWWASVRRRPSYRGPALVRSSPPRRRVPSDQPTVRYWEWLTGPVAAGTGCCEAQPGGEITQGHDPGGSMPEGRLVGLADAIQAVREELTTAVTLGADQEIQFDLNSVDIEL